MTDRDPIKEVTQKERKKCQYILKLRKKEKMTIYSHTQKEKKQCPYILKLRKKEKMSIYSQTQKEKKAHTETKISHCQM